MIGRIWHGWTRRGDADACESLPRERIRPGVESRESPRRAPGVPGAALAVLALLSAAAPGAAAQEPPTATEVERARTVRLAVQAVTAALGDELWPGFRPGRRPVLYTGLGGGILAGWRGELPEEFRRLEAWPGGAWSPAPDVGRLFGRGTTLTSLDPKYGLPAAAALAVHEHFHAYQREAARGGAAFGRGERPVGIRSYPAYDTANAALAALEGRILAAGLAPGAERARVVRRALEFLAVRKRRRAILPDTVDRWERRTERNEGLAEYVAVRTLRWYAGTDHRGWGAAAREELERHRAWLRALGTAADSSLRRRFYATGSAQALLLDRLSPGWRHRMMDGDRSLEGLLAAAVAADTGAGAGDEAFRRAARREDLAALERAAARVLGRRSRRLAGEADALLRRSDLVLVLRAPDASVCGLDPLNVRHVDAERVLHGGFLRVCGPDDAYGLRTRRPTLERPAAGVFTVPLGEGVRPAVTAGPDTLALDGLPTGTLREVTVAAEGVSLRAARAAVRRDGGRIVVTPEAATGGAAAGREGRRR